MEKFDKFKEIKDEHPENMPSIKKTLVVLKLDKSKEVNNKHLENILLIIETLEVSNFDKLISVVLLQPLNIEAVVSIIVFQIIFTEISWPSKEYSFFI